MREDSREMTARKFHSAADSSTTLYCDLGSHSPQVNPPESTSKIGVAHIGSVCACSLSSDGLGRDVQA